MLTLMEIRDKRFQTSGRNSYKSDDVNSFFDQVVESYEQMFKENAELVKRVSLLAERLEQYRKDEDSIKSAVITAQKAAAVIEQEARGKAELLVKESEDILAAAKAEVEIIKKDTADSVRAEMSEAILNAEKEARELVEKAKREYGDIILEAEDKAKNLEGAANRTLTSESILFDMLKKEVSDFKNELMTKYKSHIELISQLPDFARQKTKENMDDTDEKPELNAEESFDTNKLETEAEEIFGTGASEPDIEFIDDDDDDNPMAGVLTIDDFISQNENEQSDKNVVAPPDFAQAEEPVENTEIPFDESADNLEFVGEEEPAAPLDVNNFISEFEDILPKDEELKQEEPKKRGFSLNLSKVPKQQDDSGESAKEEDLPETNETDIEKPLNSDKETDREIYFDSRATKGFKLNKPVFSTDAQPVDNAEGSDDKDDDSTENKGAFNILGTNSKQEDLKKRFTVIRMNDSPSDTNKEIDEDGREDEDGDDPSSRRGLFNKKK